MTPAAREWADKAEEDWTVAIRENRVKRTPVHGAVCFHAQQCAEKYLKALLADAGLAIPKVHDLLALRSIVSPACKAVSGLPATRLAGLSRAAVEYRYPGGIVIKRTALAAVATARQVRSVARKALGM